MTLSERIRDEARALRVAGHTLRAIGARLGASRTLVMQLTWDVKHHRRWQAPRQSRFAHCWQCGDGLQGRWFNRRFCWPCVSARYRESGRAQAGTAVAKAIREGGLRPAKDFACTDCGVPATQYDHRDYSLPLVVEPVCARCNMRRGPGKWLKNKPLQQLIAERVA